MMIEVYAESLFSLAKEENLLDDFYNDILVIENLYNDKTIKEFMNNKLVEIKEKEKIIQEYFKDINSYFKNFLLILNKSNKLSDLNDILLRYKEMYLKEKGIEKGIIYGVSIDKKDLKELEGFFSKKLNKIIQLEFKKDESLIAGYRVEVDKKVYDTSYKYKLEMLKKTLKKEA